VIFLALIATGVLVISSLAKVPMVGGLSFVIVLILAVILLWISIKIMWVQLKTFINIMLLIIVSPLLILFGAISPAAGGFGTWIKSLVTNVIVYPVIMIMAFIAHLFFWGSVVKIWAVGSLFQLFSISNSLNVFQINGSSLPAGIVTLPGFPVSSDLAGFLFAFGILLAIPSVVNIIQSFISGKPFDYGSAIGEGFAAPLQAGRFAGRTIMQGRYDAYTKSGKSNQRMNALWNILESGGIIERGHR
jgi:hypothetical protein